MKKINLNILKKLLQVKLLILKLNKSIKYKVLTIKRKLLKMKRTIMLKYGMDVFFKISENYFASVLMLVSLKFIARLLFIHIDIYINYLLLVILFIINIKFNLIIYIKNYFKLFLDKILPLFVTGLDLNSLTEYTLKKIEIEDKYKNYIHVIFIKIITFKLLMEQEKYLFMFINFFTLQFLLFNKFLLIFSIYQLVINISKLTLYISDYNMDILKKGLYYYDINLNHKDIVLKATKNNSILLSYWICRDLGPYTIFRNPINIIEINKDFLNYKIDEKFIYGINHKFINSNTTFDIYTPKINLNRLFLFKQNHLFKPRKFSSAANKIFYIKSTNLIEYLINKYPNADLKFIKAMKNHPAAIRLNENTNRIEIIIGTSHYPNSPTKQIYVSNKLISNVDIVSKEKQGAMQAANPEGLSCPLTEDLLNFIKKCDQEIFKLADPDILNLKKAIENNDLFDAVKNEGLGFTKIDIVNNWSAAEKMHHDQLFTIGYERNLPTEFRLTNDNLLKIVDMAASREPNSKYNFNDSQVRNALKNAEEQSQSKQISSFIKKASDFHYAKKTTTKEILLNKNISTDQNPANSNTVLPPPDT